MKRFIIRFVNKLYGKNRIIFLVTISIICVLSLCVGIYAQYFYKYYDTDPLMIGINIGTKKTTEEYNTLKASFNAIFTNELVTNTTEKFNVQKIQFSKDLVYTNYDINREEEGMYNINVKIPVINIDENTAKSINAKIKTEFYDKVTNIMNNSSEYTVYNVNYIAYINQDILSIAVKSSIKQGNNSEKVIIKTYNYSIPSKAEVGLDELIKLKETNETEVQKLIKDEIKIAYNNAKSLQELGYNIYQRDVNSNMYKVSETDTYLLTQDGYVYLIYSYGNNSYTNEVDVVIF